MSKSRIFLWGMMAFVAGVGARSFIAVPHVAIWIFGMTGAGALAIGMSRAQKQYALSGLFLLAFVLGVFRFDRAESARDSSPLFYEQSVVARGVVAEDPVFTEKSQRLKVKITGVEGAPDTAPFFTLATARRFPAYRMGDELQIAGRVEEPQNFSEFDYASYLTRDGIRSVMPFPVIQKIGEGKGNRIAILLSRLKHGFEDNIDAVLSEPHGAFLKGLLLGERASLPKNLQEDFQTAGVSHIVALSGYNITIVGRFVSQVLLLLSAPLVLSFWLACVGIVLFVVMTGASASAVRAGIMGILVLVAQKEGRTYRMTNALVFAGAAMIFYNPHLLRFDAGFQLSFLATVGLIYLAPRIHHGLGRVGIGSPARPAAAGRAGEHTADAGAFSVRRTLAETLSAQVMVLPFLIYLFGRVSLVSPLANLAVLAAVPYAMAAGFAAGTLGFVSLIASIPAGWLAWALLEYQIRVISFFAALPLASLEIGSWAAAPLLLVYGVILWSVWRKSKNA